MTDKDRTEEAVEEPIEDLEAPAAAQADVAGGEDTCADPTEWCAPPSCIDTIHECIRLSLQRVLHEQ